MQRERIISFERESVEDILLEIATCLPSFCKNIQPEYFSAPFCGGHYELFDMLEKPRYDPLVLRTKGIRQARTCIAAPRGVGKTTCVVQGKMARSILFGWCSYGIILGASQEEAKRQTESLKDSLVNNPRITYLFGDIRSEKFAEDAWEVVVGRREDGTYHHKCFIRPAGPDTKIRGTRVGWRRPDFIYIDDVQNDENVESEAWRNKIEKRINTAVINTVDRRKSWEILMTGTILAPGDIITRFLNPLIYPGWYAKRFSICDGDYNSLWPEYMTTEEIYALVQEHRERGALAQFSREYMNQPIADEDRLFLQQYFKYYDESKLNLNNDNEVVNCLSIDPARVISAGSCNTAIGVIGVNCINACLFVRSMEKGHYKPDTLMERIVCLIREYNVRVLIVEVTGLHEYITQPIEDILSLSSLHYVSVVQVKPRDKKAKRAGALIPYYKKGLVLHNKGATLSLEHRLSEWPNCTEWDEVDVLSQIIPAKQENEMLFLSPDAQEESTPEKEYEELMKEDAREPYFESVGVI